MMDWAIETAAQLWCKPEHSAKEMDVDFGTSIAEALRKAKADGMREAVSCMDDIPLDGTLDGVRFGEVANAIDDIRRRANQIEKGQE